MALTASNPFEIGTKAPNFSLTNTVNDKQVELNTIKGKNGTVVMFICNHCPFVLHVNDELVKLANDYTNKGIAFIAISSNDIENYPQDRPELMKEIAIKLQYPFPYLYDKDQSIAKAYDAACTPDFYVFDNNLKTVYHGQLDDSRPNNGVPVTGTDIRQALNNLLNNEFPLSIQKPSMGCGIKWK